ncbi:autotransporter outer membrane beta-barrel domain-containing protein [Erwinia sp. CGal63]|uniref:autotransporter outer membrane beta-barrel domain-containing protein n=1 Tax=Erwinia sp. CGal63 TaxID=2919889 RepID=UPI00300B137E
MAMKQRPFMLSALTLALSPLYAAAASPWIVTDGSTLQVTSSYDSTEKDDIPLQVSGTGSQLITDSGLSFSAPAGTSVGNAEDGGILTLNDVTLSSDSIYTVQLTNATLNVTGSTLIASGKNYGGIRAKNSIINITDTKMLQRVGTSKAIYMQGGTLTADALTINVNEKYLATGIEISKNGTEFGTATITNTDITVGSLNALQAIYLSYGHLTGTDVTINSSSQVFAAIRVGEAAAKRSSLTLNDSTINATYIGIRAMGGDVTLNNVSITTTYRFAQALDINLASDTIVRGGSYQTSGYGAEAVWLAGTNTTLDASDTSFTTSGNWAHAVNGYKGAVILENSTLLTSGTSSYGIYTQNSVKGDNLIVTTSGEKAYGAVATVDGIITLDNSTIATSGSQAYGVAATKNGTLGLTNSTVETTGEKSPGAYLAENSNLTLDNSAITTTGAEAYGIRSSASTATLTESTITTSGNAAHAIAATDSGIVNITGGEIAASGEASAGLYSGSSSTVTASNVAVTASGDNAFGMIAALGNLAISDSTITHTGASSNQTDAAALYTATWSETLRSAVTLDNSTLRSDAGTGVRVKGAALDLTLNNSSLVYGGNGTAVRAVTNVTEEGDTYFSDVNVTASASQLLGNVVTDSYDNAINLTLNDGSTLNGATQNVNQLILNSASSWLVSGDSNLKSLTMDSGSVIFNNANSFSTVTVDGDLSGSGLFAFNTQLDDDSSATDRLVVSGSAAGSYDVTVSNRGGTGAQTSSGILLISVAGDASTATFSQKNTVVAGNYEYFLYKIGDQNWYLQSSLTPVTPDEPDVPDVPATPDEPVTPDVPVTPDEPVTPDVPVTPDDNSGSSSEVPDVPEVVPTPSDDSGSVAPSAGVKAYRPETAGYLIAPYLNTAYGFETIGTWHERLGAYQGNTVWARVSGRHDSYEAGRFAFEVNTTFVQLGGDVLTRQFGNDWHLTAGPMMTLGNQRSKNKDTARSLRSDLSVDVGKTNTNAYGLGGYLTVWNDSGAYLDNVMQVTRYSNDFSSLTNAKMDSYGVVASVETGYPIPLGQLRLEPQLQAMGQYMNISQTYSEGVKLKDQNLMTAQLREGVRVWFDGPVMKPYLQADVVQFLGHTPGIDMNNETMRPDVRRGYWQAGAGLSGQLNPHFSVYAQVKYSHSFGEGTEGYTGNMGIRYKF